MLKKWSGFGLMLLMLLGGNAPAAKKNEAQSEARIAKSAKYLSSDDLEGRGVETKGLNKAADFIRSEFERLGIKAQFQKFQVPISPELGPPKTNRLALENKTNKKKPTKIELKLGKQFYPLAIGANAEVKNASLVLVGYGITAKAQKYDDYAGVDVKGKVVLMIRRVPQQGNPHAKFRASGRRPSRHALFNTKVDNAAKHGAAAVIMVNDGYSIERATVAQQKRLLKALDKLVNLREKFKQKKKVEAADRKAYLKAVNNQLDAIAQIQKRGAGDQIVPFRGAGTASRSKTMPVFFASREWANGVVKKALKFELAQIEAGIDKDFKPRSAELKGWQVNAQAKIIRKRVDVKNVVGVLEGNGPLAKETIVVGAHYDHLGRGGRGSLAPWTKDIHNGADDNASGIAALLEVAHYLSKRKNRRRIVFIAFTAEEMGLLGSKHYCRNPLFPLEDTIAMFNMDMVGRLKQNKLVVFGTGTAKGFAPMVDSLNKKHAFKITKNPSGYGPSDHDSFYRKNIPVLHLFTATHRDYHRPSDDFEKLNMKGIQRVAALFTDIVLDVDDRDERPKYLKTKRPKPIRRSSNPWPDFGSVPDYAPPEGLIGMKIDDIRKDSPAAKGGVKGGDIMIKFGKHQIKNVEDFARALGRFKAGQKVKVTVLRKKKKVVLTVTLGKRR